LTPLRDDAPFERVFFANAKSALASAINSATVRIQAQLRRIKQLLLSLDEGKIPDFF
jgi:hypothetical protein